MEQLRGLKEYARRLEHALNCPRPQRLYFLSEAGRMAEDFRQGHPTATPQEVCAFLGDPKELALTFLESLDPEELRRYRTKQRNIRWGLTILAVVVTLLLCVFSIYLLSRPMDVQSTETLIIYD